MKPSYTYTILRAHLRRENEQCEILETFQKLAQMLLVFFYRTPGMLSAVCEKHKTSANDN